MVRSFAETEVEPQALEHNRTETFNIPLFRKLGDLGLLGVTVPEDYGGSGMDATACVITMEEVRSLSLPPPSQFFLTPSPPHSSPQSTPPSA